MVKKNKYIAVVLAAGQGSRMKSKVAKQYMCIHGKPMLYYSLRAFQDSQVDEIILVVGNEEVNYCKEYIIDKYNFNKVKSVVVGGKERYLSVYNALQVIKDRTTDIYDNESCYVLIHDAARPLITQKIIDDTIQGVTCSGAVVVAVPSKDTIKIVDATGAIEHTPKRSLTYVIQTPQAFELDVLIKSYDKVMKANNLEITDDAMIVEHGSNHRIQVVEGSYKNIKVTTPEDIQIAEMLLGR